MGVEASPTILDIKTTPTHKPTLADQPNKADPINPGVKNFDCGKFSAESCWTNKAEVVDTKKDKVHRLGNRGCWKHNAGNTGCVGDEAATPSQPQPPACGSLGQDLGRLPLLRQCRLPHGRGRGRGPGEPTVTIEESKSGCSPTSLQGGRGGRRGRGRVD